MTLPPEVPKRRDVALKLVLRHPQGRARERVVMSVGPNTLLNDIGALVRDAAIEMWDEAHLRLVQEREKEGRTR